jgi:hypothetical protein
MGPIGRETFTKFHKFVLFRDYLRNWLIEGVVIKNGNEFSVHKTIIL